MSAATASPATPEQPEIDHDTLEATALTIFATLIKKNPYPDTNTARRAFVLANLFLQTSEGVRVGEIHANVPKEEPPQFFDNDVWFLQEDNMGKQEWRPLLGDNGTVLQERQAYDLDAFCPNLPPEHPLNRRFKGRDGRNAADMIKEINDRKKAARDHEFELQRLGKVCDRLIETQRR